MTSAVSYHNLLNPLPCRCSPFVRGRVVRNLPLLEGASSATKADLEFLLKSSSLKEGQEVPPLQFDAGTFGVVISGAFKAQRWISSQQYVVFDVLGPGDVFLYGPPDSEVSMYVFPDVIQSMATSCLLTMNLAELDPILQLDSVLCRRLLRLTALRMRQAGDHFVRLMAFDAEHRLAYLLLLLHHKSPPKAGCPGLVPFNLTRRDLAAMSALTLETASRILSGWEKHRWIRSGRGWVEILDPEALGVLSRVEQL